MGDLTGGSELVRAMDEAQGVRWCECGQSTSDPCRRKAIGLYTDRDNRDKFHMCKSHATMNTSGNWGWKRIECPCHKEAV